MDEPHPVLDPIRACEQRRCCRLVAGCKTSPAWAANGAQPCGYGIEISLQVPDLIPAFTWQPRADVSLLAIGLSRRSGGVSPLTFLQREVREGMQRRGQLRCVVDGRYKFAPYFKPSDHHLPADWETLAARNDLELYDTQADPGETRNLAVEIEAAKDKLLAMNAKLNRLIAREIGNGDGSFLPGPGLLWRGA